jgi:hypothetical protein
MYYVFSRFIYDLHFISFVHFFIYVTKIYLTVCYAIGPTNRNIAAPRPVGFGRICIGPMVPLRVGSHCSPFSTRLRSLVFVPFLWLR